MKLFSRYTRWNFLAMLTVFMLCAGALFFAFRFILIQQVDDALEIERDEQLATIRKYQKLPEDVSVSEQIISFQKIEKPQGQHFESIRRKDKEEDEDFRRLSFSFELKGQFYLCSISTPLEQTEHLINVVAWVALAAIALMLLAIYLVNRILVKYLLRPFDATILAVRNYSFLERDALHLPETNVEEFTVLNQVLNEMTTRGLSDYRLVQEFSSNAAHEMQTPLAVMQTKLDELMQTSGLSEEQAFQISSIDHSLSRLTRLVNSLLLLTKIENNQYPKDELVSLEKIIAHRAAELKEIISGMELTLHLDMHPARIACNKHLAEILINNLLNNAIRYNYSGGSVVVMLRKDLLEISNSSELPPLQVDKIFKPFYRHPESRAEGNGLGLSIVKQICERCNASVSYEFHSGIHKFSVRFHS